MKTPHHSSRLVAMALLVASVLGLAACTDDPTPTAQPVTIKQIRDATFAASSARYRGEARFADDSSGELDGMAAADPAQGDVMVPVQTAAGVQQGELKWVDGDLYIQRVEGTPAAGATGTIGVFLRAATDRPWVRLPTQGIGQSLLSPYDPFSLLDQLTASVEVQPDGSESVDGRNLDRYVVDAAEGAALVPGIRRAELLTDKDHRLVVVRLSGDQTIEYTMSDYGTAVSVAAPPDDQIAVAAQQNRGEDPTGDYVRVAGGTTAGSVWQLFRAPATGDGACWRLDIQGGTDPIAATETDGATCIAAIDPTVDEPVQIVADAGSGAPVEALVAVMPSGSQAVLRFADKSSRTLAVDPSGFAVFVGPAVPILVVLDVTLPDGTQEACGPGSVSSLDDLDALAPEAIATLRDAAWLCLPA